MTSDIPQILREVGLEEYETRLAGLQRKINESAEMNSRVADRLLERLAQTLQDNREIWLNNQKPFAVSDTIHIDDPVHHQVLIEEEIAPIYHHPLVQRLAHIKQLSFSYLTFPTATHTRLSHSLGVCKNAELALISIFRKGFVYSSSGKRPITLTEPQKRKLIIKAKVAALLHDIGHGPFGHGLDQYVSAQIDDNSPDKFHGTDYIARYLKETIDSCGVNADNIIRILDKNKRKELDDPWDTLISNLIDSPLDVDRMDYLVRDAHMTGLSIGTVNIQAFTDRMAGFEGENQVLLVFELSAMPYITHLLYARDSMYLNCYEHRTKVVAEKMLTRAIMEFPHRNQLPLDDLILLTDERLLRVFLEFSTPSDVSYKYGLALLTNKPFVEVFSISPKKRVAFDKKKEEVKRQKKGLEETIKKEDREPTAAETVVLSRPIIQPDEEVPLKPAALITTWENQSLNLELRNLIMPTAWEDEISKHAGLPKEQKLVIVTVPSPSQIEPNRDDIKFVQEIEGGYRIRKFEDLTGFWEGVLTHLADERYNIRVFAATDLGSEQYQRIHDAAKDLLSEKEEIRRD
jgi:HD superfamily phosphohydrolase